MWPISRREAILRFAENSAETRLLHYAIRCNLLANFEGPTLPILSLTCERRPPLPCPLQFAAARS
jgi:hypothetical protein